MLSPMASPLATHAHAERTAALGEKVFNEGLPLVTSIRSAGQDELVFDAVKLVDGGGRHHRCNRSKASVEDY